MSDVADLSVLPGASFVGILYGAMRTPSISAERIRGSVRRFRGATVLLDSDLASLYEVDVKVLNQAVKRNRSRFPPDFMFQMNAREAAALRSQSVTAKTRRGGRRTMPYVFTEQGIAMLSSVLRSERAIRVNIEIMRAFVELRRALISHRDLTEKLAALERKYDGQFTFVFEAIRELTAPSRTSRRSIGFLEPRAVIAAARSRLR